MVDIAIKLQGGDTEHMPNQDSSKSYQLDENSENGGAADLHLRSEDGK